MAGVRLSADAIGNVLVRSEDTQLPRDSVVNVSQLVTYDRQVLREHISSLAQELMERVDTGLRLVLSL